MDNLYPMTNLYISHNINNVNELNNTKAKACIPINYNISHTFNKIPIKNPVCFHICYHR